MSAIPRTHAVLITLAAEVSPQLATGLAAHLASGTAFRIFYFTDQLRSRVRTVAVCDQELLDWIDQRHIPLALHQWFTSAVPGTQHTLRLTHGNYTDQKVMDLADLALADPAAFPGVLELTGDVATTDRLISALTLIRDTHGYRLATEAFASDSRLRTPDETTFAPERQSLDQQAYSLM